MVFKLLLKIPNYFHKDFNSVLQDYLQIVDKELQVFTLESCISRCQFKQYHLSQPTVSSPLNKIYFSHCSSSFIEGWISSAVSLDILC